MWWLVPALVSAGAFYGAWHYCDGEPNRSEWGSLLIGVLNIVRIAGAVFVSLVAWLVYFIIN